MSLLKIAERREDTNADARILLEKHRSTLLKRAYNLTRNPSDAHDLVQDTFARALKFIHRYRTSGTMIKWLMQIMHNIFYDHAKTRQKETHHLQEYRAEQLTLGEAHPSPLPDIEAITGEVLDALGNLSEDFVRVVILTDIEEQPYREGARILNIPIGTVMSRLSRARQKLRSCLAGHAREMGYTVEERENLH